jgi:hypothetical protein
MQNLVNDNLDRIKTYHRQGLPLDDDMIFPHYEGLSLVNVPGTIAQLLEAPAFGRPPLAQSITQSLNGPYKKVVLLLVDALGYDLFNRLMGSEENSMWGRYGDQAIFSPLTSVCPSTTASALTTLWTGQAPASHGIIGYEMWAKEYGMLINNIAHSAASAKGDTGGLSRSGFDPYNFLDTPLFGTHLQRNGVVPTTFIHRSIAHSGLSVMQMQDVNIHTFIDEADLCMSLADHINRQPELREYIYVYYSDVDTLMHHYSDNDQRVSLQFEFFSKLFEQAFLGDLSQSAAKNTLLVLLADHGSMTTPDEPRFNLANHPELLNCLVMQPTCEHRLPFFFVRPGRLQTLKDYFKRSWPDDFELLDVDQALESDLFGKKPHKKNIRERLGDVIAVSKGNAYLWWADRPNLMAGRHGGLSHPEMLVPFYALPLKRL